MNSKPQQPLTENEIETLKKMQDFLSSSFDRATQSANSIYLDFVQQQPYHLMASNIADSYVRVTDLLRKNRDNGPS